MIDFCFHHSPNVTARVCVWSIPCVGGSHSLMDRSVFNEAGVVGQAVPVTHMSDTGRMTGSGLVFEQQMEEVYEQLGWQFQGGQLKVLKDLKVRLEKERNKLEKVRFKQVGMCLC